MISNLNKIKIFFCLAIKYKICDRINLSRVSHCPPFHLIIINQAILIIGLFPGLLIFKGGGNPSHESVSSALSPILTESYEKERVISNRQRALSGLGLLRVTKKKRNKMGYKNAAIPSCFILFARKQPRL